ncbi:DNA mismatch repair endonuclease MutL [Macrococcus epidermidis]|uniref:DNA mismatch repair endonuclease MutL n=1 Tax=Macrococcus epidermidis TaxID=1902580 RepID=UPI001EF302B9|nr:DNA mismatch repair endonuclease MutL [Macrococcus epidermidis]MCG7419955.1 DNA mismatch repair endonuclease MutL [Macrococcus epidermidis]
MGIIKTLDASLSNKIAAGEVIERPQSVVKELVENAIDARATKITVAVEEAGLKRIKITDNGSGIDEDDLALMFLRHATSKISDDHDLFHIRTLGFRGEALASIASVSRVTVNTCNDGKVGHQIKVENSQIVSRNLHAARIGTEMIVEDLFYNTPARLKYVKSLQTELGKITDIINRFIMSFPEIQFTLISDEKVVVQSTGNGKLNEAMAVIYGMKIAKDFVEINGETGDYKVNGYIAKPEHTRSNRHYMSIFINGRYIKNFMLSKAIINGYHTLLPIGRYPIVSIHISMDPSLVDVNVHPTKQEVRLSKEPQLMQLIEQLIKEKLLGQNLIPKVTTKKKVLEQFEQQKFEYEHRNSEQVVKENQSPDFNVNRGFSIEKSNAFDKASEVVQNNNDYVHSNDTFKASTHESDIDDSSGEKKLEHDQLLETKQDINKDAVTFETEIVKMTEDSPQQEAAHIQPRKLPYLEVVGQVHGTYIVCQNDSGMFMIDQHAAQERIKYEYFKNKIGEVSHELQSLLFPVNIQLTQDEAMKFSMLQEKLSEIGVTLEHFGGRDYVVNEVPVWFPEDAKSTIEDLIEYLFEHQHVNLNKFREETAIMMSCKKSIKANHYLKKDDMMRLINELAQTNEPFTCPHGRPITIQFTTYELEKLFKRVM